MWRKGNTFALLVGMQTGAATVESSMETPHKLKMDLPFDSLILLLEIYLKEPKTLLIQKNINTPVFIAALFMIVKIWKHPKCLLVNGWIKQLWDIIQWNEYYLAIKKRRKIYPL